DPTQPGWQADLAVALYNISTVDARRARAALHEALAIIDALTREGKILAYEKNLRQPVLDALAKLPSHAAGTRQSPARGGMVRRRRLKNPDPTKLKAAVMWHLREAGGCGGYHIESSRYRRQHIEARQSRYLRTLFVQAADLLPCFWTDHCWKIP